MLHRAREGAKLLCSSTELSTLFQNIPLRPFGLQMRELLYLEVYEFSRHNTKKGKNSRKILIRLTCIGFLFLFFFLCACSDFANLFQKAIRYQRNLTTLDASLVQSPF